MTAVFWPLLALAGAAGYGFLSASFWERMYVKAQTLAHVEHVLGLSHRFTMQWRPGGLGQRAFAADVSAYLTHFPLIPTLVHERLLGSAGIGLALALCLYGLLGSAFAPSSLKRHLRGAQIAQRTRWSPLHRGTGRVLALGFLLAVLLWIGVIGIGFGGWNSVAGAWRSAFISTAPPDGVALRHVTLACATLGYSLAAALVYWAPILGEAISEFARRHGIPWPRVLIQIGGIRIPFHEETRGIQITGRPGSGKTQVILAILKAIRRRGDRALIADPDGEYGNRLRRLGDRLLNPFVEGSERWSPFAEIREDGDFELLAKAVIPESESIQEEEWRGYGRSLLSATLRSLHRDGRAHAAEVLRTINSAGDEELAALLAGTNAAGLRRHDEMFNSVIGVVAPRIAAWAFLKEPDAAHPPFSIREWVHNRAGGQGDWLFLPFQDNEREALQSLIATWISLSLTEMKSLPVDLNHRLVCALDEFDSLGKIGGLELAPPIVRKHGVILILGLHTKAQPDRTYGMAGSQIIMSSIGHKVALGLGDPDTAAYVEKELGHHEVERTRTTQGSGVNASGGSRSHSTSHDFTIEPVVMASELMGLKDRRGYFRRAGSAEIHKIWVPLVKMPLVTQTIASKS